MVEYLRFYRIPFTLVATKADKIAKSKRKQAARSVASAIGTEDFVAFSAMDGYGMEELLDRIGKISENETAFYGLQNTVDK